MVQAGSFRKHQWKVLLATMFCYLFFYTGRQNYGWAVKSLGKDLGVSFTSMGWISSAMLIGYAAGQLINGNLCDRYSSRKMILVGGLLSVMANVAISFSNSYTIILILWCMNGYFQSLAWAPGTRIISNWWAKEERGKAFGLYTMAAGASSVVTFLLSIIIVQQDAAWQSLFRIPVLFLLFGVVLFFVITRDKPSDVGFANLYADTEKASNTNWKERYKVVFSNRKFMLASFALGFENMARYGLLVWVPVHFLGSGWKDNPGNLWATLLMPIGMAFGAIAFGAIADKLLKGNGPAAIRVGMLISALIAVLIYAIDIQSIFLSGILMFAAGFFVYGPQSNFWPMSPELLGEKYVGTGVGVMNTFAYVFAALGEPVLGFVIDHTHNTANVFLAIAVICLLCATVISRVKPLKSGLALSV